MHLAPLSACCAGDGRASWMRTSSEPWGGLLAILFKTCRRSIWLLIARFALSEMDEALDEVEGNVSLEGLYVLWEADPIIRGHALANEGTLLCWPNKKLTGVVSFQTIAFNARVLWHLLGVWCPQVPEAKTVNIDHVRQQAGDHVTNYFV